MGKKLYYTEEEEDNIVIADMNVEGMPWYKKEEGQPVPENKQNYEVPGAKQTFLIIFGALKAALLLVVIFAIVIILFTLLCTKVWFV